MLERKETLYSTISNMIRSQINNTIHTCIPGMIERWDGNKADVKPLVSILLANGESLSYPVITEVPVMFQSSKESGVTYPLKKGDGVLLLFTERNIDNFLNKGGEQTADNNRKYSITDCIAIPGLFSFADTPNGGYDNNNMKMKHKNAEIIMDTASNIDIKGTTIDMNGASQAFVRGNDFVTAFTTFLTTVGAVTGGTSIAQNAAAIQTIATAATTLNGLLNTLLSQTIKGE